MEDLSTSSKERYPMIQVALMFDQLIAYAVLIAAFIAAGSIFVRGTAESTLTGVAILIGAAILFVFILAASEVVRVFLDIERNTHHLRQEEAEPEPAVAHHIVRQPALS